MSKLQSDVLREAITQVTREANEKKRNYFIETVEFQIGLNKNYDPQKDKRFSGSVKLPHIPRPKMKICMLGDTQNLNKNKKLVKKLAKIYHAFLASKGRFSTEKGLCMGVVAGNLGMYEKQIFQNVQLSVNFLVSLLKRNWQNVMCLYPKSSMGKPFQIFKTL
ncbi:hypothetical protein AQUCO_01500234v1 [Aquilegia coerulea]|uniref:Ribosomal protein n=1 Tax=Aquilegia coerulea TaxID=218851 RepID=A0A2G5DSX7_AQUCA|nr:hypothetical protein AQUCO_01500234v1 [Aquilegia coerulea]